MVAGEDGSNMNLGRFLDILFFAVAVTIPVSGSLIFETVVANSGQGTGKTGPVLVMQNDPSESGCIAVDGAGADIAGNAACNAAAGPELGGNEKPSQMNTAFLNSAPVGQIGNVGATRASQLRVTFNPNEGGGGGNPIQLDTLVLKIYSPTGTLLFSTALTAPILFSATDVGTGGSGFVFRIDDFTLQNDVSLANAFSLAGWEQNRVALQSNVSQSASGNETFYIRRNDELGLPETPEPATSATVTACLIGLWAYARRSTNRRRRS
ncbi:MAG: hypothetical protein ACRD8O_10705 [Bryobacteraceae bacterium]